MSQDQEYVKLKCIETQTLENMTRCSLLITNYTLTIEYDKYKELILLGDRLAVGLRTLTPPMVVQIHLPQPKNIMKVIEV